MEFLIALPILTGLLIVQTAVFNQIPLLHGTADLILLALVAWSLQKQVRSAWAWGIVAGILVGYVSAIPFMVFLVSYLIAVAIGLLLRQRIWSVPLLAMFVATFISTAVLHGLTILTLRLAETPLAILPSINLIVLPSILLNLILALPFYTIFGDLANILHPETLEI